MSPKIKTRTRVNRANGTFQITTLSDFATYGGTGSVPDISQAEVLDVPAIVDGVAGREGEAILSMGEESDAWLDGNGNLIIAPDSEIDDENRYSVDGPSGDLMYAQGATPPPQDNTLTEVGDTLDFYVNALVYGELTLQGFTDSIIGVDSSHGVRREFRVTVDGIFYTDWAELTAENLASQNYKSDSLLQIQVRYTRTGEAGGDVMSFESLIFTGAWTSVEFVAPTLMASAFASLLGTELQKKIENNLFKKLYFRGIVPSYITRAENVSYDEDRDFIALFSTMTRFYAFLITFFKRFENFRNDEQLLREQVRGFGIFFDEGNITLEELQYLAQNYYAQIQQRGTRMMMARKGETLPNGKTAAINGELVRLLHNEAYNELLVGTVADYKMGWCVRNASPLYRGTARTRNLNKTPENTEDFQSLNNFPIIQSGDVNVSVASTSEGDKRVLKIQEIGNSSFAGIGRLDNGADISEYLITADPGISYEITFAFRILNGLSSSLNLYFGVEGFDDNKQKLQDAFIALDGGFLVNPDEFFNHCCDIWKSDVWYFVRGIIHSYGTDPISNTKTNMGIGQDMIFNNPFLRYIYPRIMFNNISSRFVRVEIWDYKVRPLVWGKSILGSRENSIAQSNSLGFVQARNFMYTYARNNNNSQSQEEITDIIEKYLYPYGKVNMFVLTGV